MKFDMALIVTVEADSYPAAEKQASEIAEGLGQEGINASAVLDYEEDYEQQRVLYLHPIHQGDQE